MSRLAERLQEALGAKYRIERELGSGARGVVFEAVDPGLRRSVAIKVLRPEHATATGAERFLHEARCLARIHHPGLVAVHEVGEKGGLFFYVMDLVEGRTLAESIAAGPCSPTEFERLADGLLVALATAHEAGVVHRDVKPANIFFADGRVVLADFGIAKTVTTAGDTVTDDLDESLTLEGGFVGTPAYSSPEQLAGRGDDPRSDVFSAAAVLYEAATGRRWQTVDAGADDTWDGVPPSAVPALVRGLHPSVEERWQTAAAFHEALLETLSMAPARRSPALMWLAGIVVVVTVMGGVMIVRSGALTLSSPAEARISSILPRCYVDDEPDQTYGLETSLRAALGALDVYVPGPSARSRVRDLDPRAAADSLGVVAALECNVLTDPDSVTLLGSLIRTETGETLWEEEFRLAHASTYLMRDRLTRDIGRQVLQHLDSELPATPTTGPRPLAMQLNQTGDQFWLARTTDPSGGPLDSAYLYFDRAIEEYPGYAEAHAGLAEVWLARPARALADAAEAYPRAESLATRAMELDPLNPRPYAILGELARTDPFGDWERAGALFEESLARGRNYSLGRLWYSFYLAQLGTVPDSARTQARLAYEGDPGRPDLATGLGLVLYLTGANDSAIQVLSKAREDHGRDFETPLWLAAALIAAGDSTSAGQIIEGLDAARAALPPSVYPMLAVGYAATGEPTKANDLLMQSGEESPFWQAVANWYLDRPDRAAGYLRAAVQAGDEFLSYVHVYPLLDPFREDPAFREIVQFVGKGSSP